jgi:hypothetical protein
MSTLFALFVRVLGCVILGVMRQNDDRAKRLRQARDDLDAAQERLLAEIRAALADGLGPSAIARETRYTREWIAKIRDGKVGPTAGR